MKKEVLNYNNIKVAKEFYNCAINYYNSDNFSSFTPYVINIFLSCELLIKSLLYKNGNGVNSKLIKYQKHNLYNLFYLLPKELQKEVINATTDYNFNKELSRTSNIYNNIRYYYLNALFGEFKSFEIDPIFLKKINCILLELCEKNL